MALVSVGGEFITISNIDRIMQYRDDGIWYKVNNQTPLEMIRRAEKVLLKDGYCFDSVDGKWYNFWSKGFMVPMKERVAEWDTHTTDYWNKNNKVSLREFTESLTMEGIPDSAIAYNVKINSGNNKTIIGDEMSKKKDIKEPTFKYNENDMLKKMQDHLNDFYSNKESRIEPVDVMMDVSSGFEYCRGKIIEDIMQMDYYGDDIDVTDERLKRIIRNALIMFYHHDKYSKD